MPYCSFYFGKILFACVKRNETNGCNAEPESGNDDGIIQNVCGQHIQSVRIGTKGSCDDCIVNIRHGIGKQHPKQPDTGIFGDALQLFIVFVYHGSFYLKIIF